MKKDKDDKPKTLLTVEQFCISLTTSGGGVGDRGKCVGSVRIEWLQNDQYAIGISKQHFQMVVLANKRELELLAREILELSEREREWLGETE